MSGHSLLVLGGARSGKSRYAQARAEAHAGRHSFVATATIGDAEMRDRIARHQADRDARWRTVEAPLALAETLHLLSADDAVVLVDCLTLWTANLMEAAIDIEAATHDLCAAITAFEGQILFVANEVGLGIVPDNALARRFRDVAGRINQRVADTVDEAQIVFAGLPLQLK